MRSTFWKPLAWGKRPRGDSWTKPSKGTVSNFELSELATEEEESLGKGDFTEGNEGSEAEGEEESLARFEDED